MFIFKKTRFSEIEWSLGPADDLCAIPVNAQVWGGSRLSVMVFDQAESDGADSNGDTS